jgi:hypothetical protein
LAIPLSINGSVFEYPENFDENWGVNATGWAQAVTNGMLQRAGGNFPLLADVNFGSSFGLVSLYYKSHSSNIATAGVVRLAKTDTVEWRNNANSADNILAVNSIDQLTYNGTVIGVATGVTSITGTANEIIASSSTGNITLSTPQPIAAASTPTFASLTLSGLTPNTALTANGSSAIASSVTTATELGFVSGVTSSIQTQINSTVTVANAALPRTGGTMSGAIAMGTNKITGLGNGTAAQDAAAFGQIKLIQYKSVALTNQFATTSTSFVDTNSTISITPTNASNTILIMACGELGYNSAGNSAFVTVAKSGTNLGGTDGIAAYNGVSGATPVSVMFFNTAGSTSPITYSVQVRSSSGANTVTWNRTNTTGTLAVFELAS